MRPPSRADIGVDFDQVDDGALPDGRFNVLSVAQTRTTISYMRRGSYIRLPCQLHHLGFIGMRMAKAGFLQPVVRSAVPGFALGQVGLEDRSM